MFEYFPSQYSWNLAVLMALQLGGEMTEIDRACRPLRRFSLTADGKDQEEAQAAWVEGWSSLAKQLERLANADAAAGARIPAGKKMLRASVYWFIADRMASHHRPEKAQLYTSMLSTFRDGIEMGRHPVEFVSIPYEGRMLRALYCAPGPGPAPHPVMIHFDGFDVTKEWMYLCGIAQEFRSRGIGTLMLDHPGVGEALRFDGLAVNHDSERWARACIDWLETRSDVDQRRIGVIAPSLGGYFAPRAAAFESRLACCVAWGARWDNAGSHGRILRNPGAARSISGWVEHALVYYGAKDVDEAERKINQMSLEGIAERIRCPLLVAHGARDQQVPLEQAERTVRSAVNSPRAELRLFDESEGGVEHCSGDLFSIAIDAMADWVADVFQMPR